MVAPNGTTAVASDPDRDRVLLVDIVTRSVRAEMALAPLDEPGRVVLGDGGRVYVALRGGGAVLTIDLAAKAIVGRTSVCKAPRGLAYDAGYVHVACAGGELVSMEAMTGEVVRTLRPATDLRDVVVDGPDLLVSRFRSAELLRVDAAGQVVSVSSPLKGFGGPSARVAWRMIGRQWGGAVMVHQLATPDVVVPSPGGYSNGSLPAGPASCSSPGIVASTVSFLDADAPGTMFTATPLAQAALPVDIALSDDEVWFAVVAAGSNTITKGNLSTYRNLGSCTPMPVQTVEQGEPIAVAFVGDDTVVQTREPAGLVLENGTFIAFGGESVRDTGHQLFHHAPNAKLGFACASCHPEGREDGHVWTFSGVGPRRTQSLLGGVLATAPLHWDGDFGGFDSLMEDVFTGRMGGAPLSPAYRLATAAWVDSLPLLPASEPEDADAVLRGQALFESAAVGCASCHSGKLLTNNNPYYVGTDGAFQVPSLRGLALRAPYMHDGCAETLQDRFTNPSCGGGEAHGKTAQLTPAETLDLLAYLETL